MSAGYRSSSQALRRARRIPQLTSDRNTRRSSKAAAGAGLSDYFSLALVRFDDRSSVRNADIRANADRSKYMTFHEIRPGTAIAEHCCKRSANENGKGIAMKKLALLLSVLIPFALLSTTAEAKKDKKYRFAQYMAEPFMNSAPIVTGALKRFVINPHGEVDGLLFEDGTLAKFPPHMASEVTAAIKSSDTVSVRGFREAAGTIKALVITNEATKRAVIEHPPVPGIAKMPKHLRFAMLARLQATGKVERLLYGKKGEVKGVMLDDGTVVRFPPHAAYQFATQLQPGQNIAVEGLGTQNEYGRGIEAIAIGASPQTLQPIYDRSGRR
jgi:hypothetical protein